MFSIIKRAISAVLPWGAAPPEADEDEEEILNNINSMGFEERNPLENLTSFQPPLGQSDSVKFDVETFKCSRRTGKVTRLCKEYGVIDNIVYFEPSQVAVNLKLKPNDEVLYSVYRVKENEADRVYKVYALKNDSFEGEHLSQLDGDTECQKAEEITALRRVITGRVTQRRGREVFVESIDLWCNLDKVNASFIPVEGDWLELHAVVTVDSEVANLEGDVLEIKSLKPLLTKSGVGRITLWSEGKKEGAIENLVHFTINSCQNGFVPDLGAEVAYEAVESDQDRFRWRAVKVVCDSAKSFAKMEKDEANAEDLLRDKNGVSIKPSFCAIEIELKQVKTAVLEVTNDGEDSQLLVRTNFLRSNNCQMKLVSPQKERVYIEPKRTLVFEFKCEGKFLGLTAEMFLFHFEHFVIARRFEINVTGNAEMKQFLDCRFGTVVKFQQKRRSAEGERGEGVYLFGPRPWVPPKFVSKERKFCFSIPKRLFSLVTGAAQSKNLEKSLLQYAPYFKQGLDFAHYADWFHTLLYLEEIELKLNFDNFTMKGVYLERCEDFLVLQVPGLVEKKPSLTFGDKVILSQSWSEGSHTKYVGYIHDVREREILLKFHSSFQDNYNETECDVAFEPNVSFLTKAHEAVNRAVRKLGSSWLFPSQTTHKPPLIDFLVPRAEETLSMSVAAFFQQIPPERERKRPPPSPTVSELESTVRPRRTLEWVNEALNERQKLAVVSVLKGQGRPLPYIIFGPPGTGKTVTLVEIVVQIYRLMPESRILITTPSNSAADLLCERLIDCAGFQPGQLVRFMALYRVHEGLIPERLIPYSAYRSDCDCPRKSCWKKCCRSRIRKLSMNDLVGRHRITVATCAIISVLHYQGLPANHFSHILVDEAGQTSEPEVLISATFQNVDNGQVVLVGDPLQLGPLVCSPLAKKFGLGASLLQRLISRFPYAADSKAFPQTSGFDPKFIIKLNVNYRSVPEILSLPSQMFYNSDLIPTVSQTDGKEAAIIQKFNFKDGARDTPAALIFHGIVGQNYQEKDSPSWFNPHEIWQIIIYLSRLYALGLNSSQVGIVTPYAKQVQKLRKVLLLLDLSVPKIGSVEEFQGQEREVVILSSVRSSPQLVSIDVAHSLGFVASPQRLNVALTRARALLIIIGNPVLLSKDPYWENVVKYCVKNKSYTGCNVEVLLGKMGGSEEGGGKKGEVVDLVGLCER